MKTMKHVMKKAAKPTMKRPAANNGDDPAVEAASDALSATSSTKLKLQILRGLGDEMDLKDKIALMNKSLSSEDWKNCMV